MVSTTPPSPEPAAPAAVPEPMSVHMALASAGDARSPHYWSGSPYYMAQALEPRLSQLSYISPVQERMVSTVGKAARLRQRLTGQRTMPASSWFAAKRNAQVIRRWLSETPVDMLYAPAGSALIAALDLDIPVIYSSDATVHLMIDYYGRFSDLTSGALREAEELERAAIDQAAILTYPTRWAANSAIEHYGADPDKVFIMPYGANMSTLPDRATALAPRAPGPLRLVFVGVDWERKGGAIAVEALRALNDRGGETHLTIVGCVPPEDVPRDNLTVHPFLSKNDPAELAQLAALYAGSDFLFVPTRAECYGVVWCEAAAHGLPSISTATGGVPDVITDGVTGHTLPPEAGGADYADLIAEIAADPARLEAMKVSARDDFETRLDWSIWARDLVAEVGRLAR